MEQIKRVKKVEAEVAAEVEEARHKSKRDVEGFREDCDRRYSLKVSEALDGSMQELADAKTDAEREATAIVEEAFRGAGRVQNSAGRNFDAAIEFVIRRLGG
jgi:vacuolar-type H+-ATPase subunit H